MYDYETEMFLLEIAYLNLGLIPPSHYPKSSKGSLNDSLASLDENSARATKRKFRKFRRKTKKKGWIRPSYDAVQNAVKWHILSKYIREKIPDNDEI